MIPYVYLMYQIPYALVQNAMHNADSFSSMPICKSRHAQVTAMSEALIIIALVDRAKREWMKRDYARAETTLARCIELEMY